MIKIGFIGTQSSHGFMYAKECNIPDEKGNYKFDNLRIVAAYGVDDTEENIKEVVKKGNIPYIANSMEEMYEHCNAFMITQRNGSEHLKYAEEIIKKGYPVFIDKPVLSSKEDIEKLDKLAKEYDNVICGGSGLKFHRYVVEIKGLMEEGYFEDLRGGFINHAADIDCEYEGIFFYLPHAVEMMLEIFGYNPISVNTMVQAHDNFLVAVRYEKQIVTLALSCRGPSYIVVNSKKGMVKEMDNEEIYLNALKDFENRINNNIITKDISKLVKHVEIIIAVNKSIKENREIEI